MILNDSWYPSTEAVIELMIAPHISDKYQRWDKEIRFLRGIKRILEPSAGDGRIADYLCKKFDLKPENISCCEVEEEFISILRDKGYPVIEKDFLQLAEPYQFDIILMNPPYANGAEHVLKAWDVLSTFGGDIVAQVNAETIKNPHTFDRQKLARLIEAFGSVEYIGQPYKEADRKSNVEVAIVRLTRPVDADGIKFGTEDDYVHDKLINSDDFERNELTSANMLDATVASYNAARQVIIDKSALDAKFYFYLKGLGDKPTGTQEEIYQKQKNADQSERSNRATALNKELSELKVKFWNYLFRRTKIADIATSKVQAEFKKFVNDTGNLSFTVDNVKHVFAVLAMQREQIAADCITQTFDKLCSYDGENIQHREGWVTNDNYRVNQKVILPIRTAGWGGGWETYWNDKETVIADDIDKAICFSVGKDFTKITTIRDAVLTVTRSLGYNKNRKPEDWDGYGAAPPMYSEFFKIKIFRKGTIHLTFLDDDVWEKFNIAAAKGKNWIGAETAHKNAKTQKKHRKQVSKEYQAVYS